MAAEPKDTTPPPVRLTNEEIVRQGDLSAWKEYQRLKNDPPSLPPTEEQRQFIRDSWKWE